MKNKTYKLNSSRYSPIEEMNEELFPGQTMTGEMNLEQLSCLASAARVEVFWSISGTIPRSIAEIAKMIGKSASGTTYHMIELLRVGLIVPAGERKRRSRTETLYVLAARKGFITNVAGGSEEYRQRSFEGYAGLLRLMLRERKELMRAFGEDPSLQRFSTWRRWTIKVNAERAQAFHEEMIGKFRELAFSEPDPDGLTVAISFFMNPTLLETRKVGRKKPAQAKDEPSPKTKRKGKA